MFWKTQSFLQISRRRFQGCNKDTSPLQNLRLQKCLYGCPKSDRWHRLLHQGTNGAKSRHRLSTPPSRLKSVRSQRDLLPMPDYPCQTTNAERHSDKYPNLPSADKERGAVRPHALLLPGGQIPKPAFCLRHQNKCLCSNWLFQDARRVWRFQPNSKSGRPDNTRHDGTWCFLCFQTELMKIVALKGLICKIRPSEKFRRPDYF